MSHERSLNRGTFLFVSPRDCVACEEAPRLKVLQRVESRNDSGWCGSWRVRGTRDGAVASIGKGARHPRIELADPSGTGPTPSD